MLTSRRFSLRGSLAFCLALGLLSISFPAFAHLGIHEQIEDLSSRIGASPDDPSLYIRRGELRAAHGDLRAALRDFERARSLQPYLAEADLRIARLHLQSGRVAKARRALDRLLEISPDHVEALFTRGQALERLGLHIEAAADFTRAIQHHGIANPPQPDLYLERASALAAAGGCHVWEALEGLDDGIDRLGPAVTLQLAAIELEVRLQRHDAALVRVAQAASRAGRQERWLARCGEILERAGRPAEAMAAFTAGLEAFATLPPHRRDAAASAALEADVREKLARLASVAASSGGTR